MIKSELVLVCAPLGRDGDLTTRLLAKHGIRAELVPNLDRVVAGVTEVGCAVITAEAFVATARAALGAALAAQPPWSDFPIILFAPHNTRASALEAEHLLGNVTVLDRPVQGATLVSAVAAALRGRRRQYEAREAILRRDQFLAMLGHELRNPLAAITLALETMPLPHNSRQQIILERQTRHLARLVDDLLDVARVTTGKVTIRREVIELDDVVRRCVQGAELAAAERSTQIETDISDEPLLVDGDLVRLEEVFNNLLGNAIKYSPEHGHIRVTARREGQGCVVEVTDTGIGIAPEMIGRVFDLFAQAEGSLDRSQGGLGIGLTLVRALVELHGGTISAASEGLGHGSRFTVRLPLSVRAPATAPSLTLVGDVPRGLKVALVEDNVDLLDMTAMILEGMGCSVVTATEGRSGLANILTAAPDVAFVDIGVPGLDGFQIAERVRRASTTNPYLVAMTGYGQPEDRKRALAAGFDDHMTKPVSQDTLRRALLRAQAKRRHVAVAAARG
jgi:signal transduction histidine kinase/ActR/RegA family two-component response regulator